MFTKHFVQVLGVTSILHFVKWQPRFEKETNKKSQGIAFHDIGWFPIDGYNKLMKITAIIWPEDRIEHIARHGVTPEEVEEVCFENSLVQRTRSQGKNPVYYVLGQTADGRYLFCVIIQFPDKNGYPVTARPMTAKEKRRYQKWLRRWKKKQFPK